jgi:hypothetical protein
MNLLAVVSSFCWPHFCVFQLLLNLGTMNLRLISLSDDISPQSHNVNCSLTCRRRRIPSATQHFQKSLFLFDFQGEIGQLGPACDISLGNFH